MAIRLVRGLILVAIAFFGPLALGQCQDLEGSVTLQGLVRDSHDRGVAAATVYLQTKPGGQTLTTHTDSEGSYRFPTLRGGTYTLRVETNGYGEAAFGPFVLGQKGIKKVDITLEPAFFDEPKFTVAGVTEAGNGGVHGSDTVWRSTEALAKATASLSKQLQEGDEKPENALEAVREYQRAAELNASESNLFAWGAELLTHRAAEPAIEVFTKGNRLFPRSARMLLGLAVACYARGSYDQAARHFFEASDLNPADPNPYMFLGKVQSIEITQSAGFAERLGRFARLQPDNAWANYYYAVGLWKQRKDPGDFQTPARVRALLENAVRLDPSLAAAYLQLGILYSDRKDFPKAISAYQKAIEVSPILEEAHYRLAQAYGQTGEKLNARKELDIYSQLSKKSAAEVERERSEIQQFVFALRGETSAP
jgi:tetratricopeptide (TPR) repeat protein